MKRKYQKMNARKKIEAEASASANQKQRRTKRKTETDIKPPKRRKVTQQKDMNKVNSALKCCLQEQELLKQAAKKHCEMRKKSFLPLYLKFAALRGNKRQLYQDYNCLPTRFKNGIVSSPTDAQLIYGLPKCTKGKVSIDITEIFGAANNIAETQAAKLPDSMQQEYLLRNKNSVTFVGQTGIGKTTLCKFITTKILSLGFKDLLDIKWLFYIVIQDVDFQTETTLVDFLLSNSCSGLCKHHKISNHVSQRILKSILQSSNIVIILDGLDRLEFPSDTPTFEDKNLSEQFKPVQFVQGIIRGTLLSNAIKILTTTQKHLKIVGHEYFPMFAIEVLGWDESSQEQACVKLCGRSKGKISNFISEHPNISAYCCNPAQGIVIYSALFNAFAAGDEMLLSSIHQIYLYCLCTSLHTTSKQSRLDVEQLALLTWNNGNLKTVDSEVLKSLENLCTKKGQINVHLLNGTNPVRFSSFLWQHLFSAFYLLFVMPLPVFKHKLQYLMLQKWQEITKFTFALCNEQLVDLLSKIASTTLDKHKWDCRKDLLHNHFCKQVRTLTSKHRNSMLKMLACFYEINDDNFLQEFFKFFPESVVVCGSFASWNVRHIEKVLSLSNKNHSLHILPSAKFLGKSFKLLLKTLKSYTIQIFHLQKNLSDDELTVFLDNPPCPVDKLAISLPFPESFLEKILKMGTFNCVDLSESCIRSSTISIVAGYVFTPVKLLLPKVVVTYCKHPALTPVDVSKVCKEKWNNVKPSDRKSIEEAILTALVEVRAPAKQLCPVGNVATCALSLVLHQVPILVLEVDESAPFAIQQISAAVKQLPYKLEHLKYDSNKLNGKCADAISECICNAHALSLFDCHLDPKSIATVVLGVSKNDHVLESLILDHNVLDEEACAAVATALSRIKVLSLQFCRITPVGMKHISTAICELPTPIQSFTLGWNTFPDEMADDIGCCMGNICCLSLRGCGVSPDAMQKIASYIACLKTPMSALDITRIPVNEAVAESLTNCLHNIKKLTVSESHIWRGKEILDKKLENMSEPKPQLKYQCY